MMFLSFIHPWQPAICFYEYTQKQKVLNAFTRFSINFYAAKTTEVFCRTEKNCVIIMKKQTIQLIILTFLRRTKNTEKNEKKINILPAAALVNRE